MSLKALLSDFLISEGKSGLLKQYDVFSDICTEQEYESSLTKELLANLDLKHRFAKYIVSRQKDGYCLVLSPNDDQDLRLCSFIAYYAVTELLNKPLTEQQRNSIKDLIGLHNYHDVNYLPGIGGNHFCSYMPVIMRPGGGFQYGYRMFVVNLLSFKHKKFVMGCRCDSGPIVRMKYNKGCYPLGLRTDSQQRKWTTFQVDASLTDDYTAIFSNFLDGDGFVEICDWVNDHDVRIVFRTIY